MSRPHRFHLRLLVAWLGLALLSVQVARAATDDDDSGKSRKTKKTTASSEKSDDDTPKKKRRKDTDSDKDTSKSGKDAPKTAEKKSSGKDKDSGKTAAKSDKDKNSSKTAGKSSDETPRKRRRKEPESDKEKDSAGSKKDTGKTASKSDKDKDSGKAAAKSDDDAPRKKKHREPETDKDTAKSGTKTSGKKSADKSEITIPISKKGSASPAKDVTDQKADRPRDEKAMRDGEGGEFDNEGKSKENTPKKVEEKSGERRDLGKAASSSSSSKDMAGWEVVHYQDRDWVTSNSIFRFYRFADHHIEGNVVWFTSPVLIMKAVLGSQELLINNIKFILSNPVEEVNGKVLFSRLDLCKLIDPVLRPSYIGHGQVFDTVIVDAGHGGYDSGARGIYGYEKNFALQLAGLLKTDLEKRGLKVVLTRSDDTFISLGGRVEFANKVPNSIFVSLHFNSGQSAATGIETYALSPQGASSDYGARSVDAMAFNGNQRDSENIALATAIHASVVHHFKLVDRGVKRARWYVLTGLERPGVLFEGGFVTNNSDGQLIAADNFRRELAHTIGDAISNYRRALSH